ncbi:MAG: hypothetical protein Q4Q62_05920 [Thermoplasmata archaeon]|nr:hypothetical protein [Thermoplasmata archaeon]
MATESFEQDMILDTEEAVENLAALLDSGVTYKGGGKKLRLARADDPVVKALMEKYRTEDGPDDGSRDS